MSASGMGPFERAKQWAQANLENVEGAKLHKHDMCGWNSKGLANLTVKEGPIFEAPRTNTPRTTPLARIV